MNAPLVDQFVSVFESLRGYAHVVPNWSAAARTAAEICRETEIACVALGDVPKAFDVAFRNAISATGINVIAPPYRATDLPDAIDAAQAGIGMAAYGIAATGTLVEEAEDDALRLVSALPRTYIGLVEARELLPELKDAASRLRSRFEACPENCVVSFISGPSRTGDIEMILTLGVHGPEIAHAIIVESGEGQPS